MSTPTILYIEDDQTSAQLVRFLMERQGYAFQHASDGRAGLELARSLRPDVIILDVLLPLLDGFQVLEALHADAETARIQVLMLTGKTQSSDIVKALAIGANDYLLKPFQPAELTARVNKLLRSRA
ncbi:response regulator transcription factor [Perlucidibaca piscinae]|uniref:response regulator transcription factor n=1 Tax=Perlucidibaca piscinae TaxID=392589 RepID=UPI000401ECF3|nr:response regulator [Perlucidibaca piscinae]